MTTIDIKNRFHVYTGFKEAAGVRNALQAGEAYEVNSPETPHYIVKMWAFPRELFYLVANKTGDGNFTLFAKKVIGNHVPTFRRPVGFGFVSKDLKRHLEIQFTFPRQRVFMSLFPDQVTIDSLISESGGVDL